MTRNRLGSHLVPKVPGTKRNDLVPGSRPFRGGGTGNQEQVSLHDLVPESRNGYQVVTRGTKAGSRQPPLSGNVRGNSRDPNRGTWCTPKAIADAVGPFDLDPFSNPRSHIVTSACSELEDGGDGFGDGTLGSYRSAAVYGHASASTRVWFQPPYSIVLRAFNHYRHTRWTALLRFDPRPEWWHEIYAASELVCVLHVEFEPPPGVPKPPGNTFPHALYYRHAEDVTPAVLRMAAAAWRKKP